MDPVQLQLMQEAGIGVTPGLPGMQAPMTSSGTQRLSATADSYASPIAGTPQPDISPLAPLGLQNYGPVGMAASIAGNVAMSNMLAQNGLLPTGNAGSYMQAFRTRQLLEMRQAVSQQVAGQDADGFYRTMRGAAAMAGMPFNQQQRDAARSLSGTIASYGPALAMVAPEFMDMIAGEKGSVQSMAAQMMEANRYRVDPASGQLGLSATSNAAMVNNVFDRMFSDDNMARMQGLRAGDVGQMYRSLAAEGLVGSQINLRDRTLQALQGARNDGVNMQTLASEAGVTLNPGDNFAGLSNSDLAKLRQAEPVQSRITQSDSKQISDRLQSYVGSIAAMREVFGENGDTNAPVPKLINALKALTSGQMQRFDAAQLNTMVRDVQAMSQTSGKSIDQILAMTQAANSTNNALLGSNGVNFDHTATNVGVTTGMAFAERGGAAGFGALNREQAEQAAMSYFSRGMASEMGNTLGTLKRVEEGGGFADNDAGKSLAAIMAAARAGEQTYVDPVTGEVRAVPTKEAEYRALITAGGVQGLNTADFNMMLGDRTSNLRALSSDSELQQAPFRQQNREIDKEITRTVSNRLASSDAINTQIANEDQRSAVARSMSRAAVTALNTLTPEEEQNTQLRNKTIADALKVEAAANGVTLDDETALNLATGVYGQAENISRRFGFDSHTAKQQVLGGQVNEARMTRQAENQARAGLNEAMAGLGPRGSLLQRFFTAVQKQGDRGEDANLETLLGDMFAVDLEAASEKLSAPMQSIRDKKAKIEELSGSLSTATPEERRQIQSEIKQITRDLDAEIATTKQIADSLGLTEKEGTFNTDDLIKAGDSRRELDYAMRSERVAAAATTGSVSSAERTAIANTPISDSDLQAIATVERQNRLNAADTAAAGDPAQLSEEAKKLYDELQSRGVAPEAARTRVRDYLRGQVASTEDIAAELGSTYGNMQAGQLSEAEQNAVVRSRRVGNNRAPTDEEVAARKDILRDQAGDISNYELHKLAEDQLVAENQLRSVGQLGATDTLYGDVAGHTQLNPELRNRLENAAVSDRAGIVNEYLDQQSLNAFTGSREEVDRNRIEARDRLRSPQGAKSAKIAAESIDNLAELRREYLADQDAVLRGGSRGALAAQQSKQAEQDLHTAATNYYGGDVGGMLASGGVGMSAEGATRAEQEFARMSDPEKATVVARLNQAGQHVESINDLTAENYKAYIALQAKDNANIMSDSVTGLTGGTDTQAYAERLGVREDQVSTLQDLRNADKNVAAEAKALNMTEEEYLAAIHGGEMPISVATDVAAAEEDLTKIDRAQSRLASAEAALARDPESAAMRTEVERLRGDLAPLAARQASRMQEVGLDPANQADVTTYRNRLRSDANLKKLDRKREDYALKRQKLRDQGMSDEQIDATLGTMADVERETAARISDLRDSDLEGASESIADAFGLKDEERSNFAKSLQAPGSYSDANKRMVAGVLGRVGRLDSLQGETAIDKLDMLTDQYAAARTPEERKALAQQHGMDFTELDRMMNQTKHLKMADTESRYTSGDFVAAMEGVSDKDIAAEVQKEEERTLRITGGTIEVRGEITGQATVHELVAVGGSR